MKKGRIHKVMKVAGIRNEKTNDNYSTTNGVGTRTDKSLVRNSDRKTVQER